LRRKCRIIESWHVHYLTKLQKNTIWYQNNSIFLVSAVKSFIAPTDCSRFNAIQNTYSELWIIRYVDRVHPEIIGRLPFAERSRASLLKALYSWVHSLYGNQLDSGLQYLRISAPWTATPLCFSIIVDGWHLSYHTQSVTVTRLFFSIIFPFFFSSRKEELNYLKSQTLLGL